MNILRLGLEGEREDGRSWQWRWRRLLLVDRSSCSFLGWQWGPHSVTCPLTFEFVVKGVNVALAELFVCLVGRLTGTLSRPLHYLMLASASPHQISFLTQSLFYLHAIQFQLLLALFLEENMGVMLKIQRERDTHTNTHTQS